MKYLLTITLSLNLTYLLFATLPGNEGSININYPEQSLSISL